MRWYSTELPKATANKFRDYCQENHITFETSEVGNLIHFEVLMDEDKKERADHFIDERC